MIGIDKVLLASRGSAGEPAAEGVSFDGVNDYLSRSSDLVGNVDSKTFTVACFIYIAKSGDISTVYSTHITNNNGFEFKVEDTVGTLQGYTAAGQQLLNANISLGKIPVNTFGCLVASVDLNDTNKRHVYFNDTQLPVSWTAYSAANDINFTSASHYVGRSGKTTVFDFYGRLSHLFLAYEYVDLSVESNRRMFITADGKPA